MLVLRLMHWKMISLGIGWRSRCAGITVWLIRRPSRIGILCQYKRNCSIPSDFFRSLAPWTWDPTITSSHYLWKIEWKLHYGELIMMGRINYIIGSFFYLTLRMYMLSFKEWWAKFSLACPLFGVTLMTWSFSARYHMNMLGICKPFFSGCGGENCACTMANANFSLTD